MAAVTLTFDLSENRKVMLHGHVTCNLYKVSETWYVWCSSFNGFFFMHNSFICKLNTLGPSQNPDFAKNVTTTI